MRHRQFLRTLIPAIALSVAAALPVAAHGPGGADGYRGQMPMMGPGYGPGYGMGPGMMGPGYGMGPGMMGPGYGMGYGYGMGPGMMGPGYGMGPGMMGPGYGMGPGMMGPGYGMGYGRVPLLPRDLDKADVENMMERQLEWRRNPNLKVGKVEVKDKDTIVAEIVTKDGSLVRRYDIDRHTGMMRPEE